MLFNIIAEISSKNASFHLPSSVCTSDCNQLRNVKLIPGNYLGRENKEVVKCFLGASLPNISEIPRTLV